MNHLIILLKSRSVWVESCLKLRCMFCIYDKCLRCRSTVLDENSEDPKRSNGSPYHDRAKIGSAMFLKKFDIQRREEGAVSVPSFLRLSMNYVPECWDYNAANLLSSSKVMNNAA
ncbi:hypothetical protein AVEN_238002-1 [Araneus ventricosus]|uniref:Uncharacterized protein n=1 Tax=Araneus ventricosus TaxID=182803 RepID=A0A4Y2V5B4_ARAVE|nr:hypothetical protein AVEN_238002-1 [Araneus ventricosus]